ncbi:hypothetical protein JSO54_02795 [Riemerella anatipestifer]|uniref:hypothetical protein n=1 Tax=Riemerella anatipestifer TaxID=34085 RepID=UPI001374C951|nr:hypothetical protein [Riemerella anatipestifer]
MAIVLLDSEKIISLTLPQKINYIKQYSMLRFPIKFYKILLKAIDFRIQTMQKLIDNEETTDKMSAEIDYGNDVSILNAIQKELNETITNFTLGIAIKNGIN